MLAFPKGLPFFQRQVIILPSFSFNAPLPLNVSFSNSPSYYAPSLNRTRPFILFPFWYSPKKYSPVSYLIYAYPWILCFFHWASILFPLMYFTSLSWRFSKKTYFKILLNPFCSFSFFNPVLFLSLTLLILATTFLSSNLV